MDGLRGSAYQRLGSAYVRSLAYVGVIVLLVLACLSVGRAVQFTFFSPSGGIDFYGFWRAGLFIRQATDPYEAFLTHKSPQMPITFLDGTVYKQLPYDDQLSIAPTNTAPSLFIFYLFAWFPWPVAKTLWFLLNCTLAASLPLLIVQLYPYKQQWSKVLFLSICLIFYSLKSVRGALGTGQTTLLVVTLMVVCVLIWQKHSIVAGLVLGIALSKYSVALPLLLFALYERRFRVVGVSAIVQSGAVVALSLLTHRPPISILWNYYLIMQQHIGQPGIHLAEFFPPGASARAIAPIILTLGFVVSASLLSLKYRFRVPPSDVRQFHNLHVFTALALWTLLIAYHRPHDGMLVIFFVVLITVGLLNPNSWGLTLIQQYGIAFGLIFSVAIFILPYEEIGSLLLLIPFANQTLLLISKTVILTLLGMFVLSLWLLYRARRRFVYTTMH